MLKTLARTVLVAGALAAASLGWTAAPAAAADQRIVVTTASPDIVVAQRADRGGLCSPRQAIRKASRLGLRRAHIVRDNRRAVVVDGVKRGRLVSVRFAQVRGCPVLAVR